MLVLAFDTTSEYGGMAFYSDLECLASAENEGTASYSVTLFQMVERLLRQAKLSLCDVELFAVAKGPGSFTGIRVGLAAALAWAKAFQRPVRGVSVLEAMVEKAQPEADWAVPILDARRDEFFLGLFRRIAGSDPPRQDHAPSGLTWGGFASDAAGFVMKPSALGPFLEQQLYSGRRVACLTREHDRLARALQEILPRSLCWKSVPGSVVGAIARLALQAQREGRLPSPAELDPYYIRPSDAELHWRE